MNGEPVVKEKIVEKVVEKKVCDENGGGAKVLTSKIPDN